MMKSRHALATTLLAVPTLVSHALAAFPDCATGPLANNTVCNTAASVQQRAAALVDALTLQEKFNFTGHYNPAVPRLGLPAYTWWNEALHGIANSPGVSFASSGNFSAATSFPQPILMGAAFDDALIEAVATVVSTEARAFNNFGHAGLDFWTPNINPFRDPRWGRGQETPGEDAFHLSSYVKALIKGLEGDAETKKVVATCKHLAGYDLEDWEGNLRYAFDARIGARDLAEYYTPPFRACARDARVGSVMCSYNAVNGVPSCADSYLLEDLLREHWGWNDTEMYVTSDCDAIQNIYKPHNYAGSPMEAAAAALNAGTDLNCGTYSQLHLPAAYEAGLISIDRLNEALTRLFAAQVRLGYFDPPSGIYRNLSYADVDTSAARALALKAAEEGIVLLKNDGTLPLDMGTSNSSGKYRSMALIGSWAKATTQMQGNYAGVAPFLTSPFDAAQSLGINVTYAAGVGGAGDPTTDSWLSSLQVAREADVIVIADGIDNSIESEGNDRTLIGWSGMQIDFITEAAALGKPLVILQMGGGQLDDAPFLNNSNVSAIVWGGYPGQDGGTALMNILTGKTAPAGRLPVTQYPADYVSVDMTDMRLRSGDGFPGRTYRWFDNATLPFGWGMHYTNFSVGISMEESRFDVPTVVAGCNEMYPDLCPLTEVTLGVTNTGTRASDYVALLFVAGGSGPTPQPLKTLVGYTRVFDVQPGMTSMATVNLSLGSVARVDESGNLTMYPGNYTLAVDVSGLSKVNFEVEGEEVRLDEWPQAR